MQSKAVTVVRDELRANTVSSVFSAVATILTGFALAVWAAIEGWDGPAVALAGLVAAACVATTAIAFAVAHYHGYLDRLWVKNVVRIAATIAFFLMSN